jgi:hypothetical protein
MTACSHSLQETGSIESISRRDWLIVEEGEIRQFERFVLPCAVGRFSHLDACFTPTLPHLASSAGSQTVTFV